MRTQIITRVLLTFSILCALSTIASAQGVIVPGPCRRCPDPRPIPLPRALPIKSIKIDTVISSQVATTHVEQVFRNDTNATLEGTYLFPIPESASIAEFAIWDGDRRLVGEVRSREEARRIYDEIVRRQRDPGLLEYAGKDLSDPPALRQKARDNLHAGCARGRRHGFLSLPARHWPSVNSDWLGRR